MNLFLVPHTHTRSRKSKILPIFHNVHRHVHSGRVQNGVPRSSSLDIQFSLSLPLLGIVNGKFSFLEVLPAPVENFLDSNFDKKKEVYIVTILLEAVLGALKQSFSEMTYREDGSCVLIVPWTGWCVVESFLSWLAVLR